MFNDLPLADMHTKYSSVLQWSINEGWKRILQGLLKISLFHHIRNSAALLPWLLITDGVKMQSWQYWKEIVAKKSFLEKYRKYWCDLKLFLGKILIKIKHNQIKFPQNMDFNNPYNQARESTLFETLVSYCLGKSKLLKNFVLLQCWAEL